MLTYNYEYQYLNNIQIHTTGCNLCIYDARKFANTLPKDENAIIFNTCSVFKERERENQLLLNLLSVAFPNHKLYVLGCDVNNNPSSYNNFNNVYTNEEIREIIETHFYKDDVVSDNDIIFLKIQDGCKNKCAFCIINQLRKYPHSLPYKEIINNLRLQIKDKNNIKLELSGTELCDYYDKELNYKISDVIKGIIKEFPEISRITLTSLEPASSEIENIIDIMAEYNNILIPHINLATQSGSDTILKLMRRRHNISRIKEIHNYANKKNVSVGWDIIVGFPNETEELFNETIELIKELKPLTNTIFAYSPRKGTIAYNMDNQIPEYIKQERVKILNNIINEYAKNDLLKYNNYNLYKKGDMIEHQHKKSDKKALLEALNNGVKEYYLDIFNINEFAKFIQNTDVDYIVHINYDINKSLDCDIYINFLKEYYKNIKMVIHMPKDYDNVLEYENHFNVVIVKDLV